MSFNAIHYDGPDGAKSRQQELLKEAEHLHLASRAVRGMKLASGRRRVAKRGSISGGRTTAAAIPAMPRRKASERGSTPSLSRRPAWRTAAGKVGSSLVTVGKRLEHVGRRERE